MRPGLYQNSMQCVFVFRFMKSTVSLFVLCTGTTVVHLIILSCRGFSAVSSPFQKQLNFTSLCVDHRCSCQSCYISPRNYQQKGLEDIAWFYGWGLLLCVILFVCTNVIYNAPCGTTAVFRLGLAHNTGINDFGSSSVAIIWVIVGIHRLYFRSLFLFWSFFNKHACKTSSTVIKNPVRLLINTVAFAPQSEIFVQLVKVDRFSIAWKFMFFFVLMKFVREYGKRCLFIYFIFNLQMRWDETCKFKGQSLNLEVQNMVRARQDIQ